MESSPDAIGPYRITREIARGGMGAVYEVRREGDPRRLALKTIAAGALSTLDLERFGREAQLMARVRHPNVIPVHAFEQTPTGTPYLVCELIEGETLSELARRGTCEARRAAELLLGIARGVGALHEAGILHRDLKPDNVMVRASGAPLLLDFGIAREVDSQSLTHSGAILGTPGFMAPEQADGTPFRALTATVDVYGLGAILYFLLTGRAPFVASTLAGVLMATLKNPVDLGPAGHAPSDLRAICRRCLEKDPRDRYPSAEALAADLERFLAGESLAQGSAAGGRGLLVGLGVLALAAVALTGALVARRVVVPQASPRPSAAASRSSVADSAASPSDASKVPQGPRSLTVLPALHKPKRRAPSSCRVALGSNLHALQTCEHAASLRFLRRTPEGEWTEQRVVRLKEPPGAMALRPRGPELAPSWAMGWRTLGEYENVNWAQLSSVRDKIGGVAFAALYPLRGKEISSLYWRPHDGALIFGLRTREPRPGPLYVLEVQESQDGSTHHVQRDSQHQRLNNAPPNVRAIASHLVATTAAVGEGSQGLPVRVWWLDGTDHSVHTWPGQSVSPRGNVLNVDATAIVGLTPPTRSFFLWSDVAGSLHLLHWPGSRPLTRAAPRLSELKLERALAKLSGPAMGLAIVWRTTRAGVPELLVFAVSGHAQEPSQWGDRSANSLSVYALDLKAQPPTLTLRARAAGRPVAYTWAAVTHDAKSLLLARADCALEAWDVTQLLREFGLPAAPKPPKAE